MGNVSVYLDDDEHDWVKENIENWNGWVRNKVRTEMGVVEKEKKADREAAYRSLIVYSGAIIIGVFLLLLSVIFTVTGLSAKISVSYESFLLIIIGIIFEIVAISKLLQQKKANDVK